MTEFDHTSLLRLDVGLMVTMFASSIGVLVGNGVILLSGIIGLSYWVYGYVTTVPEIALDVTRTMTPDSPIPGDTVTVTLTVTNTGSETLPDIRVIDGVPDTLGVIDGSPACYTGLRPAEEMTIRYTVRAKRGEFTFADPTVIVRNLGGTSEQSGTVPCESTLRCVTWVDQQVVDDHSRLLTGETRTNTGGSGIEFYATREYQPGDPMKRINWNRLAKANELTTVEYHEQRAGTVVMLIDVRSCTERAPSPDMLTGHDLSLYAAEQAYHTLREHGNRVGAIFYGSRSDAIPPGVGTNHMAQMVHELSGLAMSYQRNRPDRMADGGRQRFNLDEIRLQLPPQAQVLLLSPGVDQFVPATTRYLRAHDYPVTVLSPDLTNQDSVGRRLERVQRHWRLQRARTAGARVIDWQPTDPISIAVGRAIETWL